MSEPRRSITPQFVEQIFEASNMPHVKNELPAFADELSYYINGMRRTAVERVKEPHAIFRALAGAAEPLEGKGDGHE